MNVQEITKGIFKKFDYSHLFLLILGVAVGYFHEAIQKQLESYQKPKETE